MSQRHSIIHFRRCNKKKCDQCDKIEKFLVELAKSGHFSFPIHFIGESNVIMMRRHRNLKHCKKEKDRDKNSEPPIIIDEHSKYYYGTEEIQKFLSKRFAPPKPA
jgi:hypothetical protein